MARGGRSGRLLIPLANRTKTSYVSAMTGAEFLRKIHRLGRARGVVYRFDRRHGKGSHGTLHYGNHKTTVKDLQKEIGVGLLRDMLDQLGLSRCDLDE